MARSRTVLIAGGGIGGLTAALAVAAKGFRAVVVEQAPRLEEAGAGIQLSPNATRVLSRLGVADALAAAAVQPSAVRVRTYRNRDIVRIPLGAAVERRYGAPYWVVHRADLQTALLTAVQAHPDITLRLGTRVENFAVDPKGVLLQLRSENEEANEHGIALIGADGLWSTVRARLGDRKGPRFAHRTAWRAVMPARVLVPELREPVVSLWLGPNAHLVAYPVGGGEWVNVVAIVRDEWHEPGWSAEGRREDLLPHYDRWPARLRNLLALPDHWLKWALHDRPPRRRWGRGPVTLLGDAAHPMLPFLAQGAAMAIEDAAVLAEQLARHAERPQQGFRRYERKRARRTARVQRAARSNGRVYHLKNVLALFRNAALRRRGGDGLLRRYDWLYGWRP